MAITPLAAGNKRKRTAAMGKTGNAEKVVTGWRGWLADMAAATALLTILPVPMRWQNGADWPRAMRALPLVGLGVGTVAAVVAWLALLAGATNALAALLAVLAGVVISGALHEDGLADMADALGGASRRKRLEILRDVHAGTFAILALVFAVALQAAALGALLRHGPGHVLAALVAAHMLSRNAMVVMARRLPAARKEGMGHGVAQPDATASMIAAPVVFLLLLFAFGPLAALLAMFLAIGVAEGGMEWLARKYFGGQTGDILGATEVVVRTTTLLALAMLAP